MYIQPPLCETRVKRVFTDFQLARLPRHRQQRIIEVVETLVAGSAGES